jgi:hypothetical protein
MYTRAEKAHLVQDAIAFKKVPRVPLVSNCSQWQVMDAGMTFTQACYDWDLMLKACKEFVDRYYFDYYRAIGIRNPVKLNDALGANAYVITDDSISVPDNCWVTPDDFKGLMENYDKYLWEVIIPRKCVDLKTDHGLESFKNAAHEYHLFSDFMADIDHYIFEEKQTPRETRVGGSFRPYFESLFNMWSGIKACSVMIRRNHDQVKEYCDWQNEQSMARFHREVVKEVVNDTAASDFLTGFQSGTILNLKQFEEFLWPYWKEFFNGLAEHNKTATMSIQSRMIYFKDFFREIPKGHVQLGLEIDDVFEVRKECPNLCINGGMPVEYLGRKTPEECIEYAKMLIDRLDAGNGGFVMGQNKMLTFKKDAKRENLLAVTPYCLEHPF